MLKKIAFLSTIFILSLYNLNASATESHAEEKSKEYDPVPAIMHHISDAHEWHFWDTKDENGVKHSATIPLPVILYTENGLVSFMSSEFHHDDEGHHKVHRNGVDYVKRHGKIYTLEENKDELKYEANINDCTPISFYMSDFKNHSLIVYDTVSLVATSHSEIFFTTPTTKKSSLEFHPANAKPMDFSITKNVVGIFLAMIIIFLIFISVARSYKKNGGVPSGLTGWMEPLVLFVRDEIALPNIGEKKHRKYTPLLLTIFFFIWVLNLLGLIPGGANVTGNIAVTLVLACVTMVVVAINGNKEYWKHIFWPPVPHWLKPLMIPVEIIGMFTKPFALMIRLFANITAGHIIILSLVSLIFIFKSEWMGIPSMLLVLFISVLELLVAVLQAYVFTLLTALFIGVAVDDHGHEHEAELNEI